MFEYKKPGLGWVKSTTVAARDKAHYVDDVKFGIV
jgi:hypothetical protein